MRYYAYFRCSTDSQMEKNGFQMQKDVVYSFCKEHGIILSGEFCDEGISGTYEEREGLYDLLGTMEKGDKVIVQNTSRLWRDEYVKVFVHKELKRLESDIISIEAPKYTIYEKDPNAFLFNAIMEAFDQYDRMSISAKLYKGRRAAAQNGKKGQGRCPIGYKWKNTKVVPSDDADMIKVMFEKFLETKSLTKTKRFCDEIGFLTQTGKPFCQSSIGRILDNDFYIGIVTFGSIKKEGVHEPIISKEIFNSVMELRRKGA